MTESIHIGLIDDHAIIDEGIAGWCAQADPPIVIAVLTSVRPRPNPHLCGIRVKYAAAGRDAPTKAALLARAIQDGLITADDL